MFASSEEIQELLQGLASILWGLLSVIGLFALAVWQGSLLGVGFAVLAAGTTYVFQELQRHYPRSILLPALCLAPVLFWLAGFLVTVIGV